jgi:hypothetical protein
MPPRAMQPRAPETVQLFLSSAPAQQFVEVGILGSSHASAYSSASDDQVILALRDKAASVGCDGVVMESETNTYFGQASAGTVTVDAKKRFRAVCIMFINQPAVQE